HVVHLLEHVAFTGGEVVPFARMITQAKVHSKASGAGRSPHDSALAHLLQARPKFHCPTVVAQWTNARYSWTERTAADPSPTAAATRLIDPDRTSPTANNPG